MTENNSNNEYLYKSALFLRGGLAEVQAKVNALYKLEELEDYIDIKDSPIEHIQAALAPLVGQVNDFLDYAHTVTDTMELNLEEGVPEPPRRLRRPKSSLILLGPMAGILAKCCGSRPSTRSPAVLIPMRARALSVRGFNPKLRSGSSGWAFTRLPLRLISARLRVPALPGLSLRRYGANTSASLAPSTAPRADKALE